MFSWMDQAKQIFAEKAAPRFGWLEERGEEHSCVFVSQRYMICCHGGFLLGFHLILSNAKCCVFSFASFEDNRTQ